MAASRLLLDDSRRPSPASQTPSLPGLLPSRRLHNASQHGADVGLPSGTLHGGLHRNTISHHSTVCEQHLLQGTPLANAFPRTLFSLLNIVSRPSLATLASSPRQELPPHATSGLGQKTTRGSPNAGLLKLNWHDPRRFGQFLPMLPASSPKHRHLV